MWTNQELKEKAKTAFKANYWPCVGAALLMSILSGGSFMSSRTQGSSTDMQNSLQSAEPAVIAGILIAFGVASLIGILIKIFLANPVEVGGYYFFECWKRVCLAPG